LTSSQTIHVLKAPVFLYLQMGCVEFQGMPSLRFLASSNRRFIVSPLRRYAVSFSDFLNKNNSVG
jgi:hypothetical protein